MGSTFKRLAKGRKARWYVSFTGINAERRKIGAWGTADEAKARLKDYEAWVIAYRTPGALDEALKDYSPAERAQALEDIGASPEQRQGVERRIREQHFEDTTLTVGQLAEMWAKAKADKRSLRDDVSRFVEIVAFFGADEPIALITADRVEAFRDHLKEDGAGQGDERKARKRRKDKLSPGTINRYLQVLRGALHLAEKRHHKTADPFRGVSFVPEDNARDRLPTEEEIALLLNASGGELRLLITLARWTAMRAGEILGLEWSRLDLKRGVARLEARHTKARKLRDVPLPPEAVEALRAWPRRIGVDAVFERRIGTASSAFTKLCRSLGIKGLRLHDFRHLRLTELLRAGANVFVLQEISGHKDLEMLRRYSHVTLDDMQRAVRAAEKKA